MTDLNRTFIAENRDGRRIEVEAESVEDAAAIAGGKFYPRRKSGITVYRTTGNPQLSGWFQGYVALGGEGTMTSAGQPFHVTGGR